MVKTQTIKYIILQAVIVVLTASCCVFPDALFMLAVVTVQIGLFSAIASQKPFCLSLIAPLLSYGVAFALFGNWMIAFAAVLFFPAGAFVALCVSKSCSRSKTVLVASLCFGLSMAVYCGSFAALNGGITVDELSKALYNGINYVADMSVDNLPEVYFSQGITKEAYRDLLFEAMRLFFMGVAVLICNAVAYFSTAITKKVLLRTKDNKLLNKDKDWLYVLSKPSAAMFVICYLCVLVGGDALTLPQQIAFNTVIVALLGGVLVMAARSLKQRMGIAGISSVLIYVVIYFILGMQAVLVVMSVTGLIAAFRYKPQEDKEACKK